MKYNIGLITRSFKVLFIKSQFESTIAIQGM